MPPQDGSERCSSKWIAISPAALTPVRGEIELDDLADREVDDLLDDVRELVLKNRGQIVIVPAERMPAQTGIAPSIGTKQNSGIRGRALAKAGRRGGLPSLRHKRSLGLCWLRLASQLITLADRLDERLGQVR
jgi:hypothetical protein